MAQIISVVSGKGGNGKSVIASNLACGFRMMDKKCLLIDFSFGARNDDILLSLTSEILYNISDIYNHKCDVDDAIICPDKYYLPNFISASPFEYQVENLNKIFVKTVGFVSNRYDYIIIDTSSSIGEAFESCMAVADVVIDVTEDDFLSVTNNTLCISRVKAAGVKKVFLVINKSTVSGDKSNVCCEDIIDETGISIIGIVPNDELMNICVRSGEPVIMYDTPAGRELENICLRINGENIPYNIPQKKMFEKNKLILKNKKME